MRYSGILKTMNLLDYYLHTNSRRSVASQNNHIYGNGLSGYIHIRQIRDVTNRQLFTCGHYTTISSSLNLLVTRHASLHPDECEVAALSPENVTSFVSVLTTRAQSSVLRMRMILWKVWQLLGYMTEVNVIDYSNLSSYWLRAVACQNVKINVYIFPALIFTMYTEQENIRLQWYS